MDIVTTKDGVVWVRHPYSGVWIKKEDNEEKK
jgi:hypothetical protein